LKSMAKILWRRSMSETSLDGMGETITK